MNLHVICFGRSHFHGFECAERGRGKIMKGGELQGVLARYIECSQLHGLVGHLRHPLHCSRHFILLLYLCFAFFSVVFWHAFAFPTI